MNAVLSPKAEKLFEWLSQQDATVPGQSSLAPWQIPFQDWGVNGLRESEDCAQEVQRYVRLRGFRYVIVRPAGREFLLEFDNRIRGLWHQYEQQRTPMDNATTL